MISPQDDVWAVLTDHKVFWSIAGHGALEPVSTGSLIRLVDVEGESLLFELPGTEFRYWFARGPRSDQGYRLLSPLERLARVIDE